jgi:hypothetical protein
VAAKSDARSRGQLLALTAPATGDMVDDDPHGAIITGRRATTQSPTR